MNLLVDGAGGAVQFLFAHGAGAPMDSVFMSDMAERLAAAGAEVVRFEFPYMAARRRDERRPPDRETTLRKTWSDVVAARRDARPIFIGGKSMGGRIATMVADELDVHGVICFGYPFHPPGKPASQRVEHLRTMRTPALVIQGTRDQLGSQDEVEGYTLPAAIRFVWLEDGDHSLKPRVKSGFSLEQHLETAALAAAEFMLSN